MDLSAKTQLLKRVPYFRSLPLGRVRELAASLPERHYRGGHVISRKGDRCEGLCIVLSGRVRTVITSEEGREQVLKVFGPGRTFGDIPVFDDEPNPADAVAVTESTRSLWFHRPRYSISCRRHPDLCIDVIRLFASRLRAYKTGDRRPRAPSRWSRVWRDCSSTTHAEPIRWSKSPPIGASTTHRTKSPPWSDSAREVVQRALKALEHAGLVESERRRIHVIDVEALSTWTEQTAARPTTSPVAASR